MAERATLSLPLLIHSAGRQHVARLRNLSCTGTRLETVAALARGARLVLSCGTIKRTPLSSGEKAHFGVRFLAPVRESVVRQQLRRHRVIALWGEGQD